MRNSILKRCQSRHQCPHDPLQCALSGMLIGPSQTLCEYLTTLTLHDRPLPHLPVWLWCKGWDSYTWQDQEVMNTQWNPIPPVAHCRGFVGGNSVPCNSWIHLGMIPPLCGVLFPKHGTGSSLLCVNKPNQYPWWNGWSYGKMTVCWNIWLHDLSSNAWHLIPHTFWCDYGENTHDYDEMVFSWFQITLKQGLHKMT